MNSSTKDKVQGKYHEVTGKIKEVAGKLTDNPSLEVKGQNEHEAGRVQTKVGEIKKVLGS
ncbi:MAG: CsbD family protein [Candidatus Magnetominusculus sp. LBB02]|nr:CsbD family protein [Candidatus Magnetominusculus sp. LBB02]